MKRIRAALAAILLTLATLAPAPALAAERYFPETQQTVRDAFLDFFDANGGIEAFGYPRTGEFEQSQHVVQYFQRARMEYWPENPPDRQVQLGLLGIELGKAQPPSTQSSDPRRRFFDETLHSVGGAFRSYFELHGGVPLFGYPITDEVAENGLTVQYFQRARFEWHPELPVDRPVQLGLIGDELLAKGLVAVPPAAAPRVRPTLPAPVPPEKTSPGKLLVSTGAGGDFYIMGSDGSNPSRLGRGIDPAISRDGTRIAYTSQDEPAPGLYVADATGAGATLVYRGRDVRRPVFSPDGASIAFDEGYACLRPQTIPGLPFSFNKEDQCSRVKVVPASGAAPGQDYLPAGQSSYATSPTWSPDGRRLMFKDEKALFVVDLGNRDAGARQISQFQPLFFTPDWAPTGGYVAVALDLNRDHQGIALVPDNGEVSTTLLTPDPPSTDRPFRGAPTSIAPAWAPDGRHIAFASDRDGALRIWVMGADGSDPTQVSDLILTPSNARERYVSWGR